MKKILGVLLLIAMLVLSACGESKATDEESNSNESDDSKVIRAGIGLNEDHPQFDGLKKFKEIVEEKSDGNITVELFPGGQIGDDREMIQALQNESLEVTVPSTAPLANFVPEFNIFNFPFLIPDKETADRVRESEVAANLLSKLEEYNLKGLGYWEEGFYNISNSKRPIETVGDLEGLKIRTMENDVIVDAFNKLGANPTPMAFGEVYTALQQGVVDAQTNPLSQIYASKFYEVQDYVSATNDFYGVWVFLMSKPFYDSLNSEQQGIVEEAAKEAEKYYTELARSLEEEYKEKLIDEGVKFNEISAEEKKKMKEKIQPVLDEYSKEMDDEIVEQIGRAHV